MKFEQLAGTKMSRAVACVLPIWLLSCALYAAAQNWHQLSKPPAAGYDFKFAVLWIAVGTALALSLTPGRTRRVMSRLWGGAITLSAVAIVISSGAWLESLAALILLIAAVVSGSIVLRKSLSESAWATFLIQLCLGLAIFGVLGALLGALGWLKRWLVASILVALLGLAVPSLKALLFRFPSKTPGRQEPPDYEKALLLLLAALFGLANFTWAITPELKYDALNYHLPVAAEWAEQGRIVELTNFFHSYYAGLVESLFAVVFCVSGPIAVKVIVFAAGVVAAFGTALIARELCGNRAAVRAGVLFYTVPLIGWNSSTADVELFLCAFLTAALTAFLFWIRTSEARLLLVAFALIGAAIGTKPVAVLFLPMMVPWLVNQFLSKRHEATMRTNWIIPTCFVLLVAFSSPWYVLRYMFTGNPVFPLLTQVITSNRPAPPIVDHLYDAFRVTPNLTNLAMLPYNFTFHTPRFQEPGGPDGTVGVMLLIALPWGLLLLISRDARLRWIVALAISHVLLWALIFGYTRFYAPVLPWITVMGIAVVQMYSSKGWGENVVRLGIIFVVVAHGLALPLQYWELFDRFPFMRVLGRESDEALLARTQRGYAATQYINAHVLQNEKVLTRGLERVRFYVKPSLYSWEMDAALQAQFHGKSDESLARALRLAGFRFIVIDRWYPDSGEPYTTPSFLSSQTVQVFEKDRHEVYVIRE